LVQPHPSVCSVSWLLPGHCCCCCWLPCSCPAVLVPSCRCKQAVLGAGAGAWQGEEQQQQLPRMHLGLCLPPSLHHCRSRQTCQSAATSGSAVSTRSSNSRVVLVPCRCFVQRHVITTRVPLGTLASQTCQLCSILFDTTCCSAHFSKHAQSSMV
jgi:hypothetical protein